MNKKMRARKRRQARRVALTLVLMLTVALVSIGGTLAWLTDKTETVTNTFVSGNVTITLNEADVYEKNEEGATAETLGKRKPGTERVMANEYQVIPGNTYDKDPTVTVAANSEECYLFVKFEESGNPSTYYTYTSMLTTANGWTQGTDTIPANVWYRVVPASNTDTPYHLLAGDTITVNAEAVTESTMAAASAAQLKWTAYACQTAKNNTVDFTPAEAWDNVPKN